MRNLAIIEYKQNIPEAIKFFNKYGDVLFLSVSGEASYHLTRWGIDFITDESVFTPEEFKEMGRKNFEITEQIRQQKELPLHGLNFYNHKILIDTIRINRNILKKIIKKENPQHIGHPKGVSGLFKGHGKEKHFHRDDSVYGFIAKQIAEEKNIKTTVWRKVNAPLVPRLKRYVKHQRDKIFAQDTVRDIVIQHGAFGFGLNESVIYKDFGHNWKYLSWGEGVAEMYNPIKKGKCQIIPTGSPVIEDIRRDRRPRTEIKNVCYVSNTYRGNTHYYPNGQPCRDSELFLMETRFLKTLIPYQKKYNITYKIAPEWFKYNELAGINPMIRWVKENLPHVKIESKPLVSIIHDFDCFIIDWPMTSLVQACATGAEVMVYIGNKYYVMTGKALDLLRRRALVGIDEYNFKYKIKKVLDRGRVFSDVENIDFLLHYGIYKDDGLCQHRVKRERKAW